MCMCLSVCVFVCVCACVLGVCVCGVVVDGEKKTYEREGCLVQSVISEFRIGFFFFKVKQRTTLAGV